jgi:unsaturated rhamnogalacturonyl hydrolase
MMRINPSFIRILSFVLILGSPVLASGQALPDKAKVLKDMELANAYFMKKWPDPGLPIVMDKVRTSNLWTRAVYKEGLMEFYKITKNPVYLTYMTEWGERNKWGLWFGKESRHADSQLAGLTYLDLYLIDRKPERIADIKYNIDKMVDSEKKNDWTWIDAIEMSMPVFAKLGVMYNDNRYFEKMHELYLHSRDVEGGGLYNKTEKLWWRDKDFVPPYKTPDGKNCYWSRGNGWVVAALVKVMEIIPENSPHYNEYKKDYLDLMEALLPLQREDAFWNVSLADPNHFGGKELSGTALFCYGMAWGMNKGWLDKKKYLKPTVNAWNAMVKDGLHSDGMLGYVQSTGKEPKDGQPLSYDKIANFEDYGLGCFLLAGTEIHKLKKK